jgi:acetoin utilization deacetylase AcuC-like enzyme
VEENMKVFFHDDFYQVYASDPAAAPGRMEAVVSVIEKDHEFVRPEPASEADILAVHTGRHVERIKNTNIYDVAALAAGGAVQAATLGLTEPCFGLIRPPGHHASADSCWGFCYFNNMAVALQHLKQKKRIRSAYVLDIDLHFGDGTDNILGHEDWVTVHNVQGRNREAFVAETGAAMARCSADIIGISAGFDNHEDDWGGTLTTGDYAVIGRQVRDAARRIGGGCFAVLEGGYNHDVLGDNVAAMIRGLGGES